MGRNSNKFFFWHIEFAIDSFKGYVSLVEGPFEKELLRIEKEYIDLEASKPAQEEDPYEYHEHLLDDLIDNTMQTKEFIQRFRESIIIQLYSFLETEMRRLCEHFEHKAGIAFNENDPKWKGKSNLDKFKSFLKETSPINFDTINEYGFIYSLRLIRNNFVHSGSYIESNDKYFNQIKNFSKNNFTIQKRFSYPLENKEVWKYEIVLNNNYFLDKCINKIRSFFHEIEKL